MLCLNSHLTFWLTQTLLLCECLCHVWCGNKLHAIQLLSKQNIVWAAKQILDVLFTGGRVLMTRGAVYANAISRA